MRSMGGGPTEYVRVVKDAAGLEHEEPADRAAFDRVMESLETETVDIRDRAALGTIRDRGGREITALAARNRGFGEACDAYYASRKVAEPFQNLNENYWV